MTITKELLEHKYKVKPTTRMSIYCSFDSKGKVTGHRKSRPSIKDEMLLANTVYRIPMTNELISEFEKEFKIGDYDNIGTDDVILLFRKLYDLPERTLLLEYDGDWLYETGCSHSICRSYRNNPPMFYIVSNFREYELTEDERKEKEGIEKEKNNDKLFKTIFLPRLKSIFNEVELEVDEDDMAYDDEEIEFEKEVFFCDQDKFCLRELVKNKIKETVDEKLKNLGIDKYDLDIQLNVSITINKNKILQQLNNEGE